MQEYLRDENIVQKNIAHKSYCVLTTEQSALSDTAIMFVRQFSVHKADCLWKEAFLVSDSFGTQGSEAPAEGKAFKYAVGFEQGVIDAPPPPLFV